MFNVLGNSDLSKLLFGHRTGYFIVGTSLYIYWTVEPANPIFGRMRKFVAEIVSDRDNPGLYRFYWTELSD